MKKVIGILILVFLSCEKDEGQNWEDNRSKFLVDKIFDNHDNLIAEYFYDTDNKLIKKVVTDNPGVYRRWVDEFEYEDGRVSKIIHDDQTFDFDYDILVFYNTEGQLVRSEIKVHDIIIEYSIFHYDEERVKSVFFQDELVSVESNIEYDNNGNAIKHIHVYPKMDPFGFPIPGEFIEVEKNYEYDNRPKPNFGLDYLFAYNPLPYNESGELERGLSQNNMKRANYETTTWIYTYNEFGLPETIETRWDDIPLEEPSVIKLSYIKVE
jgi:hypothetical protein